MSNYGSIMGLCCETTFASKRQVILQLLEQHDGKVGFWMLVLATLPNRLANGEQRPINSGRKPYQSVRYHIVFQLILR